MSVKSGGLKGFISRAKTSSLALFTEVQSKGWTVANFLGKSGMVLATTAIIVLMPLIMEISRETQVLELDKLQVKDLKLQGYSDQQLLQMGFTENVLFSPNVLEKK